jgi:superfamily II DNA or RNA helicase
MLLSLPELLGADYSIKGNPIRQIAEREPRREGTLATFTRGRLRGFLFQPAQNDGGSVLFIPGKVNELPAGFNQIIRALPDMAAANQDLSSGIWLKHPHRRVSAEAVDHVRGIREVLQSWEGAFSYIEENPASNIVGLRAPQLGALHAIHAHWSVSDSVATIVMPTGTGKTEVMLSILISARCPRVLVVVPTDALRFQLSRKFETLGVLKSANCKVLSPDARFPVVCTLQHIPNTLQEVDEIFERSQVIVTTSSIVAQCKDLVQNRIVHHCPYLFIDEAHHAEAPTWSAFKERFNQRRIVQFTATPFREDGKPLDGEIVFKYPLKKAQKEGYFKPINFTPVVCFSRTQADEEIAAKVAAQLRVDSDKRHIAMARVENITRAKQVSQIYSRYPEFNPVELHTGIKSARTREATRKKIISGESRLVVCVDMLGEGFDLPELKIAAFHDIRKTLAVTLQLAGRFTRSRADLGDATFIANTADVDVRDELRKLYSRDPDWNVLLPELSERVIGEQKSLQEFVKGFSEFAPDIPLRTVRPATSMVVYRTTCHDWTPEKFRAGIPAVDSCELVYQAINASEHTLVVVTARRVPLPWTEVEALFSWEWELYVAIWSPEQNLLYINSSTNAGEYKSLAQAIAGETVSIIKGDDVFRSFAGVNRLRLQNVGLTEQLGRNVRYTGRMGSDVGPGVTDVQRRRTRKSVLSGTGYENGETTSVGASRKGRIWSHRRERVDQLVEWCKAIGAKLLDASIDPDEVLKGTLEAEIVASRPGTMPIGVDWPEAIFTTPEALWSIRIDDQEFPLSQTSLELASPTLNGPLYIELTSGNVSAELELELFQEGEDELSNYRFNVRGEKQVHIQRGERATPESISSFFYENPPVIWFADGSSLEGNEYVELKTTYAPYDRNKIDAWYWTNVDIRKESQGDRKDADSIQARVIQELRRRNYHVIVDDDGSGEAADVVAIVLREQTEQSAYIDVEFYHCKYSHGNEPGTRVNDLYEVCGQAQKSIFWISSSEKKTDLFTHLMRRQAHRENRGYELGDKDLLYTIREMSRYCPVALKIFIVQPGLSKANATEAQLRLLSVSNNYLMETHMIPFGVIASG